jgi:hypothetical protein
VSHEKKRYTSDLSDAVWEKLKQYLPLTYSGRRRPIAIDLREVVNAMLSVLKSGCQPLPPPDFTLIFVMLGVLGVVPVIGDIASGASAILNLITGNPAAAALDAVGMFPGVVSTSWVDDAGEVIYRAADDVPLGGVTDDAAEAAARRTATEAAAAERVAAEAAANYSPVVTVSEAAQTTYLNYYATRNINPTERTLTAVHPNVRFSNFDPNANNTRTFTGGQLPVRELGWEGMSSADWNNLVAQRQYAVMVNNRYVPIEVSAIFVDDRLVAS